MHNTTHCDVYTDDAIHTLTQIHTWTHTYHTYSYTNRHTLINILYTHIPQHTHS